jgi:nucleoside-diphosphate-sugar epimerase
MSDLQTDSDRLAVVFGAAGSLGQASVAAFRARGWRVRGVVRRAPPAEADSTIEWVQADAAEAASLARAAAGATVIVHAANPPGYRKWRELGLPMLDNAIAAAGSSGARLIFPGNIYNFAPVAGAVITERTPQMPISRKGHVRVEMEARLAGAAQNGVRSVVIRAGDFFGVGATSSWLTAAMVKSAAARAPISYPGAPAVGHSWAYLPDFADTIAAVATIERKLPTFDTLHFAGHWVEPGIAMAEEAARALGRATQPIRSIPWALLRLAAPFSGFVRELLDVRYLWNVPIRLDNSKLVELIGHEPHTPLDQAVRRSLVHLCKPSDISSGVLSHET